MKEFEYYTIRLLIDRIRFLLLKSDKINWKYRKFLHLNQSIYKLAFISVFTFKITLGEMLKFCSINEVVTHHFKITLDF